MDMMDNSFSWCGYKWDCKMEGGRIIHLDYPWCYYSLDAINVCENEVLELSIRENPKEIKYWDGKTYTSTYEAGTMRTLEDFSYGTFSLDIMLPAGTNLWPAFWLSGSGNWPPEIDIMEGWSENDKYFDWFIPQFPYLSPSWRTTTNIHYRDDSLVNKSIGSRNISWFKQKQNPVYNYIEYKCIWHPDKITFLSNGVVVREISGEICQDLVRNINNPSNGYRMSVIIDLWCEKDNVNVYTPMKVKNFKYEPYKI